jgi:DNA repair ATPase RecN
LLLDGEVSKIAQVNSEEERRLKELQEAQALAVKAYEMIRQINTALEDPASAPAQIEAKDVLEKLKLWAAALHYQELASETNELEVAYDDLRAIEGETDAADAAIEELSRELARTQDLRKRYAADIQSRETNILGVMTAKATILNTGVQPSCQ